MQPVATLSDAIREIEWHDPDIYDLEEIEIKSESDLKEDDGVAHFLVIVKSKKGYALPFQDDCTYI